MKTTKFFLMAALALTFAACSNDDNDILNPAQPAKGEGITITATLAPKDAGATTREVSEGTNEIVTSWDTHESIAILYTVGGTKKRSIAAIKSVDASGTATIEFTVASGTPDNTECTLVYPYTAAKSDYSGVKDYSEWLASQWGNLTVDFDVRVGAGKIQTTTPGLDVTTQPKAQYSIFKFTVKNSDASANIEVNSLTITIGAQNYVITPSSATSELFAALPPVSGQTVSFSATDSDSKTYVFSKDGVTFTAGKYYQSTLKMAKLTDLSTISSNYEAKNGEILTGTLASNVKISIAAPVAPATTTTVTLKDANINGSGTWTSGNYAGITCEGNATIILEGTNTVQGFASNYPGIYVPENKTLTIMGSGSLTVQGKSYAAGIGGGAANSNKNCGNIVIKGGNITATGGSYAAGIGTGRANNASVAGGNIEINGGTIYATGGSSSAAIGTGYVNNSGSSNTCGTITINGGSVTATGGNAAAGIGTGSANNSGSNECGAITINGGTVIAIGKTGGAGIGTGSASNSGSSNTCGAITISTGVTSVTATKGNSSPNIIGKGYAQGGGTQTCGTITFGATQVFGGSTWSPDPMAAGTYGGLNLVISKKTIVDDTWTLTPAP